MAVVLRLQRGGTYRQSIVRVWEADKTYDTLVTHAPCLTPIVAVLSDRLLYG